MPFTPRPPSSGSGGNATVPDDAPIQPPQAFVDCTILSVQVALLGDTSLDWSNKGIAGEISIALVENLDSLFGQLRSHGLPINLSGNAISNTDAILSDLAGNGNSSGMLDLSGGTNAEPTNGAHIDGEFTIECAGVASDAELARIYGPTRAVKVYTSSGDVFANSTFNANGGQDDAIQVYTDDSPTDEQIASKIAELFPSEYGSANATGTVVRVTITPDTGGFLPLASIGGAGSGGTVSVAGNPLGGADIATLISNGWTVTVNIGGVPTTFAP